MERSGRSPILGTQHQLDQRYCWSLRKEEWLGCIALLSFYSMENLIRKLIYGLLGVCFSKSLPVPALFPHRPQYNHTTGPSGITAYLKFHLWKTLRTASGTLLIVCSNVLFTETLCVDQTLFNSPLTWPVWRVTQLSYCRFLRNL